MSIAEEVRILGFTGAPEVAEWLPPDVADALLDLPPTGNVLAEQAADALARVTHGMEALRPALEGLAVGRAADLAAEHERVRDVADLRGRTTVTPQLPVDVLGVYVYLPAES